MTTKFKIPYAEFYITNVCNLTCTGCNHFNDVKFRGFQEWNDYADQYSEWSKIIEFGSVAILGGEPLLNPSFMSWLGGKNKDIFVTNTLPRYLTKNLQNICNR